MSTGQTGIFYGMLGMERVATRVPSPEQPWPAFLWCRLATGWGRFRLPFAQSFLGERERGAGIRGAHPLQEAKL